MKRSGNAEEVGVELVSGWPGEPHYWGNRSVHDEEVEAAIHGLAPSGRIVLLSVPGEQDPSGRPRARILKSEDDAAVLFIAHSLEEAWTLSGVAERLCDTGTLVRCTSDPSSRKGTRMIGTNYRRTDKSSPRGHTLVGRLTALVPSRQSKGKSRNPVAGTGPLARSVAMTLLLDTYTIPLAGDPTIRDCRCAPGRIVAIRRTPCTSVRSRRGR